MKRHLPLLRRIALVLLVCWLVACGLLALLVHYTGTIDEPVRSDVIVVLGAALTREGKPYRALSRRAEHAADLWAQGRAGTILCTGGFGPHVRIPRSEADGCREVLMRRGIPRSAIVLEEQSQNTEEQALRIRDLMATHAWQRATLVSDSYHVFRARYILSGLGVDVALSPVPAARIGSPAFYLHSLAREVIALHEQALRWPAGAHRRHIE